MNHKRNQHVLLNMTPFLLELHFAGTAAVGEPKPQLATRCQVKPRLGFPPNMTSASMI